MVTPAKAVYNSAKAFIGVIMKYIGRTLLFAFFAIITISAHALVEHDNVSVVEVPKWESGKHLTFKLSNGAICYIPADEKDVYDLIVKIFNSKMEVTMHCHETPDSFDEVVK